MKLLTTTIAAVLAILAAPVSAQDSSTIVSAENPEGVAAALSLVGYSADLKKDDVGDPLIVTELAGFVAHIYFYDCDDATRLNCQSIRLSTGFDRKEAWNADEALSMSKKFRFAAVLLDDEGDPYIQWDIITGEGIPMPVFLTSIRRFESTVQSVSRVVFEEERAD